MDWSVPLRGPQHICAQINFQEADGAATVLLPRHGANAQASSQTAAEHAPKAQTLGGFFACCAAPSGVVSHRVV